MAHVPVDPSQDTEFHDALRARGIIPQIPNREPSPEPPTAEEQRDSALKQATVADLDAELEVADDEEERILQQIRAKRLSELNTLDKGGRFGRVYPISRPDYTREVTEASRQLVPGTDKSTAVVCFLFNPACVHH